MRPDVWTRLGGRGRKEKGPHVAEITNGNLVYDLGNSRALVTGLCDSLEGWGGVGGGRVAHEEGDLCTPTADSC